MKSKLLLGLLAVAVLVALAIPALAAAPDGAAGAPGLGLGLRLGRTTERPVDVLGKALGLGTQELYTLRHSGKSWAEIAKEKGVETDKLIAEMIGARQAALNRLVAQGTITQAQADQALQYMQANIKANLERVSVGPASGRGQGARTAGQGLRRGMGPGRFGPGPASVPAQ